MNKAPKIFFTETCGATAIEYALIAGSIAVAIVAVIALMGDTLASRYQMVVDAF